MKFNVRAYFAGTTLKRYAESFAFLTNAPGFTGDFDLEPQEGFEPPTLGLQNRRSGP